MVDTNQRTRAIVTGESRPMLPPYIKLVYREERGRWVIQAPERVYNPDEIAVEVLKLCDGERTVADIAEILAKEYNAPTEEITADIIALLQDLADKGVVKA